MPCHQQTWSSLRFAVQIKCHFTLRITMVPVFCPAVLPWWFLLGETIHYHTSFVELGQRDMSGAIPDFSLPLLESWACWWGADNQQCQTLWEGLGTLLPSSVLCPYFLGIDLWRRLRQWKLNASVESQSVILTIVCFLPTWLNMCWSLFDLAYGW